MPKISPTKKSCHVRVMEPHEPAEEPVHQAARLQLSFQVSLVVGAAPHFLEYLQDTREHDQVQDGDQVQEPCVHQRADRAAGRLIGRAGIHYGAEYRPCGHGDADADRDHDRRVAHGEEESAVQRSLAVGDQLARGVVDA
jgi:hypothetical protein